MINENKINYQMSLQILKMLMRENLIVCASANGPKAGWIA